MLTRHVQILLTILGYIPGIIHACECPVLGSAALLLQSGLLLTSSVVCALQSTSSSSAPRCCCAGAALNLSVLLKCARVSSVLGSPSTWSERLSAPGLAARPLRPESPAPAISKA